MSHQDAINNELDVILETLSTRRSSDGRSWRVISPGQLVYFDDDTGVYTTQQAEGASFRLDGRGVRVGIVGTGIPYSLKNHPLFDDPRRARDCVGSILQSKKTQAFSWRLPQAGHDVRHVSKQSIIEQGYYDHTNGHEEHDLFTYTLFERELFGATFYTAKVASSYAYTHNKASNDYTWEYRYDAYYSSSRSISSGIGWLLEEQVDILCFTMEILGLLPLESDSVEHMFTRCANSKITNHGQDDHSMLVFCPVGNKNTNDPASMGVFARSPSVIAVSAVEKDPDHGEQYLPTRYAKIANASGTKPDLVGIGRTERQGTSYMPGQAVLVYTKILSLTRHYMNRLGFYPDDITPKFLYDEIIEPGAALIEGANDHASQIGPGRLVNMAGALEEFFRMFPTTKDQQMHDVLLTRLSGMAMEEAHIQLPYRTDGLLTLFFALEQENDVATLDIRVDPLIKDYTRIFDIGHHYKAVCIIDPESCHNRLQQASSFTATLSFCMTNAPQTNEQRVVLHFWPTPGTGHLSPSGCVMIPDDYQNLGEKIDDYIKIFETFKLHWDHIRHRVDIENVATIRNIVKLLFNHIGTARFLCCQAGRITQVEQSASFFTDHFAWLNDQMSLTSDESAVLHLNESLCQIAQGHTKQAAQCLDHIRHGCDPEIRAKIDQVRLVIKTRSTA